MKKNTTSRKSGRAEHREAADIRLEYDFSGGVRGKYAKLLKGTTLVALQPEVAVAFPTAAAVNEALRAVLKATAVVRRSAAVPKRSSYRRSRSKT